MNDFDNHLISDFFSHSATITNVYEYDSNNKLVLSTNNTLHPSINDSIIDEVVQTVGNLLDFMNAPKDFTCYLFFIDKPKILEASEFPSKKNVNSGFTIPNSNDIFIYRSEEYERVIIHECIHALGMDWKIDYSSAITKSLIDCWKTHISLEFSELYPHLFEAWTELYAEWLYCIYFTEKEDVDGILWDCQRAWQDFQAIQILSRFLTNKKESWTEDTNVFAYYVLKACLAPIIGLLFLTKEGKTNEETFLLLCKYVSIRLNELKSAAEETTPKTIALSMMNLSCLKD
jgi:hypothetical protein